MLAALEGTPAAARWRRRLEKGGVYSWPGVAPAAQPLLTAMIGAWFPKRPLVVVTANLKAQELFQQDLDTWRGPRKSDPRQTKAKRLAPIPSRSLFFPAWEDFPHHSTLPHADVIGDRLETLMALTQFVPEQTAHAPVIVTNVSALMQRTFPRGEFERRLKVLRRGDKVDPLDLIEWLEEQAYEPELQVSQKGELALRGGIVDLFPLTCPWPVRLEFFGDELESLRTFDPQTQISRDVIDRVTLTPAGEIGILRQTLRERNKLSESTETLDRSPGEKPDRTVPNRRSSGAAEGSGSPLSTLLDYLPSESLFILANPGDLDESAWRYADQIPADDPFFVGWEELRLRLRRSGLTELSLAETHLDSPGDPDEDSRLGAWTVSDDDLGLGFQGLEAFRPVADRAPEPEVAEIQRREFFSQIHRWLRQDYAVHVFCNNDGERQRFGEIWEELGLDPPRKASDAPGSERPCGHFAPNVHLGVLGRGFICESARLVVITDAEVFGRYKVQRPRRLKTPHAAAAQSALNIDFTELREGDYVVHLQQGIGRFVGLHRLPGERFDASGEKHRSLGEECLVIEYLPRDPSQPAPKLYVPLTEAHLVGKYVGAGRGRPPMNRLGGSRWAKTKARATEAVRDLAAELLEIQAARASQWGFSFPDDAPWQREFEGAFLYEETPDQLRAIEEAKNDMRLAKPMDRLICGDVGFGKTEVAIRAAFKAVLAGRQVGVLVPTTVLAQQHFNTFRERMADYPMRIELLSRFRTKRQQEKIVADLGAGAVDIVIGTHRLIQPDVRFKELGLVIVDEEQRFGVAHKERLKQLRKLVDVLTLSATPIPRTLYLALTGARDMSTIETPPQDRLPVETLIAAYDERLIQQAIQRELNRGGQVFFLHNRILDIDRMAMKVRALVPRATVDIGHGQMKSDQLERVMTRFVNGETDVLVSTTIIESGIDIPNANTILINRADRFGLSDLYQLRGRVGRYKHQAYAYLLIPRHSGLLADARKRITAIKQFSKPGSGFKIAMRDLEIRGAGNLLGHEQSGHITAVGFELYCQLLKQSIAAIKGEPITARVQVNARFDFLDLSPVERPRIASPIDAPAKTGRAPRGKPIVVSVPREVATYVSDPSRPTDRATTSALPIEPASACFPLTYISEIRHRIDLYRKLAQAIDGASLRALRQEARDRFGPLPPAAELLLELAEVKLIAGEKDITAMESREDKLMLTRRGDYLMVGSRFPRLTKRDPRARLKEVRRLLESL